MFGFGQSAFTIVAAVDPAKEKGLRATLDVVGADPASNPILPFGKVDGLHFCAFVIIEREGKPILLFEASIDGGVKKFLRGLANQHGSGLNAIFGDCHGYDPRHQGRWLVRMNRGYNTFFVGCPGRTVRQILDEEAMRQSISEQIDSWQSSGTAVTPDKVRTFARKAHPLGAYSRPFLVRYGLATVVVAAVLALVAILLLFWRFPWPTGIVLLLLVLAFFVAYRHLLKVEKTDRVDDNRFFKPSVGEAVAREDFGVSNHFASATVIKPGWFRAILLRGVLFVIHLAGRFIENKGQLGGIPSIHFARWLIVERDTLVFLSNYGGSWESYLNDFIDKASGGLTAVWSNTGGFPRSRGLIHEGAKQEREFKVYARNSQVPTLVWYRAYPDLNTTNIENNTRIREGVTGRAREEDRRWLARL
jgi:hypothetical protein